MSEFRIACIDAMNSVVASNDEFATTVKPRIALLQNSYDYYRSGIEPWNMPGLHVIRSSTNSDPDSADAWDALHDKQQFESCAQYLWYRHAFYVVEDNGSGKLKCSCPYFVKAHVCKHTLLIKHTEYDYQFPPNAVNDELSSTSKRRVGRPGEVLIQQKNRKRKK